VDALLNTTSRDKRHWRARDRSAKKLTRNTTKNYAAKPKKEGRLRERKNVSEGAGKAPYFLPVHSRALTFHNLGYLNTRKHSIRVTLDAATDIALHDYARRESRAVANAAFALIKAGLEAKRQQQRPEPERNEPQQ
jgi:hypothetical protein